MMRYLSLEQQDLYHQYSQFGKQLADIELCSREIDHSNAWNLIAAEGIWSLPLEKKFGGKGLSWKESIIALDAILTNYPNVELLCLLLSQIKIIYLISQYGKDIIKKLYLPRLIKGEVGILSISKSIDNLSHQNTYFKKSIKQSFYSHKNAISINLIKNKNDIIFMIFDKNSSLMFSDLKKPITNSKSKFTLKEKWISILCDLINFERLVYGVLSASLVKRMDIKKASNQN